MVSFGGSDGAGFDCEDEGCREDGVKVGLTVQETSWSNEREDWLSPWGKEAILIQDGRGSAGDADV